jgi:hypothetical protein
MSAARSDVWAKPDYIASLSHFDPEQTFDPIFLSQVEFWRPRRSQRFVSFHDVPGLVPDPYLRAQHREPKSKTLFNGAGGLRTYMSFMASPFQ